MSIEQSLERLAVVLEALAKYADIMTDNNLNRPGVGPIKPGETVTVPADAIPGDDATPVTTLGPATVKTPADLRTFVQSYLDAAEKKGKSEELVTFVQAMCKQMNPKEPKLIKLPADKISIAAQKVYDWGMQNDVIVG